MNSSTFGSIHRIQVERHTLHRRVIAMQYKMGRLMLRSRTWKLARMGKSDEPKARTSHYEPLLGERITDGLGGWYSADGLTLYREVLTPGATLAAIVGPKGQALYATPNRAIDPRDDPDDPGTRDDGRRLSVQEQAARYRAIRRVLWNHDAAQKAPSMTPAEKLTLITAYEMTDLYPGTIQAGGCVEPVDLNMGALASRVGVSAATAGHAVQHLASVKLLERKERYEEGTGHRILSVAPARKLGYNEVLPEPERREAQRNGKRCKSCGSANIEMRCTCLDCGTVERTVQTDDPQTIAPEADNPTENSSVGPAGPVYSRLSDDSSVGSVLVSDGIQTALIYAEPNVTRVPIANTPTPDLAEAAAIVRVATECGLTLRLSENVPYKILVAPPEVIAQYPDVGDMIRNWREQIITYLYNRDESGRYPWMVP